MPNAVLFADIPDAVIGFIVLAVVVVVAIAVAVAKLAALARLVNRHLGTDWRTGTVLTRPVPNWERVNLFLALEALREQDPAAPPVLSFGYYNELAQGLTMGANRQMPLEYAVRATSLTTTTKVVAAGLYFLKLPDGKPFVALLSRGFLETLANTPEESQAALDRVLHEAAKRNVYRGQVVTIENTQYMGDEIGQDYQIVFHDMPAVPRSEIVLPEDVLKVVERNVIGLLTHAETLRRAGRGTRHGVLFHGPPGVGKTLVTKYLARARPNYTVILMSGRQLRFVRESCQLAKLLQPALIVIEDVDLIATDRSQNFDTTLLHELMDEMDGLGTKADVIFLLTTNRPRALEGALATRPGRVDQAIYFPLPDRDCRKRIFDHFSRGLDLSAVDVEPLLDKTDGASPAFIGELFRKAALMAAERGEQSGPLKLTTADFTAAIRELIEFGGALTQQLLGYRSDPDAGGQHFGFVTK
jgi:ATP-dependent 26S proteasome regulatory subunit